MRPRLYVMVKVPRPGRVKTRLGRQIGMVRAAWWFRHQVARLLRRLEDPRWELVLAVAPDREGLAARTWPGHLPRVAQGQGNLGARMARLLRRPGQGPVCIIGADVPGVTRAHVARAFRALADADAVIGPATDGGYWLIGMRGRVPAGALENVRWSSPHAMTDTLATLRGLRVRMVDVLSDVDEAADLDRLT